MAKRRQRPAALLLYALSVAVFVEGASRLMLRSEWFLKSGIRESNVYFRLNWVERHRKGMEIARRFDAYHPTRGWTLVPGLRDLRGGQGETVSSNSRGVRGQREYATEKPAGVQRIVVVGDSFSFGEEASDEETYAYLLEQRLPNTEVINLAVHGYGHDQMLITLREAGMQYHPDIVLLGFLMTDMVRNTLAFRDYAKPRFELRGNELELRDSPVPAPETVMRAEPWRLYTLDVFRLFYESFEWRSGRLKRRMDELTLAILDEMVRTTKGANAIPLFVYLPERGELQADPNTPSWGERFLLPYCGSRAVRCLSVRAAFVAAAARGQSLYGKYHFSAAGHAVVANEVQRYLAEGIAAPPRK